MYQGPGPADSEPGAEEVPAVVQTEWAEAGGSGVGVGWGLQDLNF